MNAFRVRSGGIPEEVCAVCYLNDSEKKKRGQETTEKSFTPQIPYKTSCCGAVYCYYCIKSAMMGDKDGFVCLRCLKRVESIERVQ